MAFTKYQPEHNMEIIRALNDEPNDVDGLSAAELKGKFDQAGEEIQEYLVDHIDELENSLAAASIGAKDSAGNASTVQAELNKLLKLNVELFDLTGAGYLLEAQAAYNWVRAGNYAIVKYGGAWHTQYSVSTSGTMITKITFYRINNFYITRGASKNTAGFHSGVEINAESGSVISVTQVYPTGAKFLDTDIDYGTPYTPLYNGSPATKKYVDDHHDSTKQDALPQVTNDRYLHTNASTGALEWSEVDQSGGTWGSITGTLSDQTDLQAALNAKGTYNKPAGGIPSSDMASAVQTSLGKADTALQEHQSLAAYRTSAAQDVIDATKSSVSVSASGTATDEVQYITVNGVEKKLAGGSSGGDMQKSVYDPANGNKQVAFDDEVMKNENPTFNGTIAQESSDADGELAAAFGFSDAVGDYSFSQGAVTEAIGTASHSEGIWTAALGEAEHVEGILNIFDYGAKPYSASKNYAVGDYCISPDKKLCRCTTAVTAEAWNADHWDDDVEGEWLHVVGNGTMEGLNVDQSNAYTLDRNGNGWFSGDVYVGSTSGKNKDAGSKKLIADPGSGSTGDVLKKTADGVEWGTVSGLPEVSGSGKALVSVNGAWVPQSGYGYETNVTVTWDGDTTGKRTAFFEDTEYYKISDVVLTKSQLTLPITGTWTENGVETSFTVQDEDVEVLQNIIWHAQYYLIGYFGGTSEQNGIYFPKTDSTAYVNKVTLINSVQQIDSKYIPHDSTKQDTISDLLTIRSGAALGTTSIQNPSGGSVGDVLQKTETGVAWGTVSGGTSIPTIAITMSMISAEGYIQLTEAQAAYMASTDYPLIRFDMSAIPSQDYILSRMYTESAFASFCSTICGTASAQGGGVEWVSESSTVWKFVTSNRRVYMDTQLMQEAITDLSTIRSGAALGATALQSVPNTYRTSAAQDVIDATKVNTTDYAPTSKTSAMTQAVGKDADGKLWTTPSGTESDPVFTASAAYGITSGDISNWNAKGTYSKPSGGIPSTDMTSAVQTSLGKADSALQNSDVTYYTAAEIETLWGEVTV